MVDNQDQRQNQQTEVMHIGLPCDQSGDRNGQRKLQIEFFPCRRFAPFHRREKKQHDGCEQAHPSANPLRKMRKQPQSQPAKVRGKPRGHTAQPRRLRDLQSKRGITKQTLPSYQPCGNQHEERGNDREPDRQPSPFPEHEEQNNRKYELKLKNSQGKPAAREYVRFSLQRIEPQDAKQQQQDGILPLEEAVEYGKERQTPEDKFPGRNRAKRSHRRPPQASPAAPQ